MTLWMQKKKEINFKETKVKKLMKVKMLMKKKTELIYEERADKKRH